jgi:aminoglycoside phosphotransferase (APT) family kinase protein
MAVESRWQRGFPFHDLNAAQIDSLIAPFLRGRHVLDAHPLSGGLRNSNYLVYLSSTEPPVVLRVFSAEDPGGCCAREAALASLLAGRVPLASVLHSEPNADPPWNILSFVDASRFDIFLLESSVAEIAQASHSAGESLAAIHSFTFEKPGWILPDLSIGPPPWPQISWREMLLGWFDTGNAGAQLSSDLRKRVLQLIDTSASRVTGLAAAACLVHADYKPWNLLVRDGRLAAVVDWEFAYAGNPLVDLGIYLRYSDSHPPAYRDAFANGYRDAGGSLPPDWFELARLTDLVNLGFFLEFRGADPVLIHDVTQLIEAAVTLLGA